MSNPPPFCPRRGYSRFESPRHLPGAPTGPPSFRHRRDCHADAGSFFDAVPSGTDAHLLKHVIHD
jgi:hypothetical protein